MLLSRFIKRLTRPLSKIHWSAVFLELIIVFIGVYLAFLFNNYQENRRIEQQTIKVLVSLKLQLEEFRIFFPGRVSYQQHINQKIREQYENQEMFPIWEWRFVQPQYDFTVIEYAIETRETEVVDFTLYEELLDLFSVIQRLEYAEEKMTTLGDRYQNLSGRMDSTSSEFLAREADNRLLLHRFLLYAEARRNAMADIAELSEELLSIINARLGPERRKQAEIEFIKIKTAEMDDIPRDSARQLIKMTFPHFENSEVKEILEQVSTVN